MSKALFFWVIYIVAVIVVAIFNWPFTRASAPWLILMLLVGVIGWAVFGAPVH